jgi:hypothetical protein
MTPARRHERVGQTHLRAHSPRSGRRIRPGDPVLMCASANEERASNGLIQFATTLYG